MKENKYRTLRENFNNIDFQMAKVLLGKPKQDEPNENREIMNILLLILSRLSQEGQLSLSLVHWGGKKIAEPLPPLPTIEKLRDILENFYQETKKTEQKILGKSEDTLAPILWIDDCLYLNKNRFFEKTIVRELKNRINENKKNASNQDEITKKILSQLFTLVNGGPGSGKTTLIFSLIKKAIKNNENTRIKLLATTGKAANRIQQSLRNSWATEKKSDDTDWEKKWETILNDLIGEVETIHRFLRTKTGFIPKKDGRQKIFDLIIIDEASMMPPSLFAQIFLAIDARASLVILGDRHQLPAVNSSNLIEDLLQIIDEKSQQNSVVTLTPKSGKTSHRFDENSPIGHISSALRDFMDGKTTKEVVWQTLDEQKKSQKGFDWNFDFLGQETPEKNLYSSYALPQEIEKGLKDNLTQHYAELEKKLAQRKRGEIDHHSLFDFFFKKMVLTSHRHGKMGEKSISAFIKNQIVAQQTSFHLNDPYHEGRIVLFLHNDYKNQIFNGDIGIILKDQKGMLRFYLYLSSRSLPVHSIPPENMQTLYALTIHKSQGSEFEQTIVIFSPEKNQETSNLWHNTFLSPNLLYTALTRSKKKLLLYLPQKTLEQILSNSTLHHQKPTPFRFQ